MKRLIILSAWLLSAYSSQALVRFTMMQTSATTVSFYFAPEGSDISFSTDIFLSNVTFTLRIPSTYPVPTAAGWNVTGNTFFVTNPVPDAIATSANEAGFHNVKFGWTSGNNMNGKTFVAGHAYRLADMTIPAGVAIADITFIDWAANRVNGSGPLLYSTSLNMGGLQEDDAQLWYQSVTSNPPVNGGSTAASSTLTLTGIPMPVRLLSFDAAKVGEELARLSWETAQEQQTDYFNVERSGDGKSFASIGQVKANGKAGSYQLYDHQPLRGTNYYRLKYPDLNGTSTYSAIRTVIFSNVRSTYTISPNPANELIRISGVEAGVSVRLIGTTGQILRELQADGVTTTIGLDGLAPGMYYVQVIRNGIACYSQSFIKQ